MRFPNFPKPVLWLSYSLLACLFLTNAAWASSYCGHGLAAQVGQEYFDPTSLIEYLDSEPTKYVGALRIEDRDKPRTVVLVRGELPASSTEGLRGVGNDRRFLASKSLILPPDRVRTESLYRKLGWGAWGVGGGMLGHELINPGLIPNNLPVVPAVMAAFVLPPVLGTARAVGRRLFASAPKSEIALAHGLAAYLYAFTPPRPGLLRRMFRWGLSHPEYLHVVLLPPGAVGESQTERDAFLRGVMTQLSSLTSEATVLDSLDEVRQSMEQDK